MSKGGPAFIGTVPASVDARKMLLQFLPGLQ